eukprot:TRINITY_DN54019_c0_g1_i1.p1 TRINITY_DN54019_c0_g1~~TRINITY_DN54019_c0_g1_i1.p1  ORF type:complete len:458 (+),score=154.07 TRINITY_DN54019_c0_g1_i1:102-1475(+)
MAPKIRLKLSKPRPQSGSKPKPEGESAGSPEKKQEEETQLTRDTQSSGDPSSQKRKADDASSADAEAKRRRIALKPSDASRSPMRNLVAASPAYGGRSPAYGNAALSPGYYRAGMSPAMSRPNPHSLGGVLSVPVTQMLKELAPCGYVEKTLFVVTADTTLGGALDKLSDHGILAMPVVNAEGKYVDMVEMLDIVRTIVGTFSQDEIERTYRTGVADLASAEKWHEFTVKGEKVMKDLTVQDALNNRRDVGGDVSVLSHIDASASVRELLEVFLFSRTSDGRRVHRVVLLTPERDVRAMVSQSDMLKYIYGRGDLVKAASLSSGLSLRKLGLDKRRVVVTRRTSSLLYAFSKMAKYNAHSLAVIDESNKLTRHLSASDLKGLKAKEFPLLLNSIDNYGTKKQPVTLTSSATLWETISLFVRKKIHRATILDAAGVPISIVSITNILGVLTKDEDDTV